MRLSYYHSDLPTVGCKPGGVAIAVHRLANAMSARGHSVTMHTYSRAPIDASYRVHTLRPRAVATNMILRQYVAPFARNVDLRGDCDVVHLHGDDWFYWPRRHPSVRTFYGSSLAESRSATNLARRIDKRLVYGLERLAGRLADVTIAIGPDSEAAFGTDLILPPGITDPGASTVPRSPHPTVLFVGTWDGRKRGAMLADVFATQVRSRLPDAELWMVSDRCPERPGLRWFKAPTDADLQRLYASAWVFCLPSTYEGFGIPYVEALAAGTAVVATPNPGAHDVLQDGRYGRIVDTADLGATLRELLDHPAARQALETAGRVRARAFTWSHLVMRYEASYALAIERYNNGRD